MINTLDFISSLSIFSSDDYCRIVAIDHLHGCLLDDEALIGVLEEQ